MIAFQQKRVGKSPPKYPNKSCMVMKANAVKVYLVCAKEFWPGKPNIFQHLKECDQFSYKLVSRKHWKAHINRAHSGIIFKCNQCGRDFTENIPLRLHIHYVHDSIQFLCNNCTFKGNTQGDLLTHNLWMQGDLM